MPDQQRTLSDPPTPRGPALLHNTADPRCVALAKLAASIERTGSALSVGLEPCEDYLPAGFAPDLAGFERFLRCVIDATAGLASAYKFNLAFFEALGPRGWDLLFRIRAALPKDAVVIADAKRGDIGSTAGRYARALFTELDADAATVNPLMGRDSAEPFLAHADRLTYFLVLTSNAGASDFLIPGGLYRAIASAVASWNARGNCGAVVGATKPEQVAEVRALMPGVPFLIPGIGAQGGDLEAVAKANTTGATASAASLRAQSAVGGATGATGISPRPTALAVAPGSLLFHVTRGILPAESEPGDPAAIIRAKATQWHARIAAAIEGRAR